MKAINILNKFKTFFGVQNILIHSDIDEALAELDEILLSLEQSCDGCKHNYLTENIDMDTGERLDGNIPNICYECKRNYKQVEEDKYEK